MRRIAGPNLTPVVGEAPINRCSSVSASTIRCTVDLESPTLRAILPKLSPLGSRSNARRIVAARAIT